MRCLAWWRGLGWPGRWLAGGLAAGWFPGGLLDRGVCPFEAVEDQAEPVPEFAAVVIAGLQDVPGGQLGEVRVLLCREVIEEGHGHRGGLLGGGEGQAEFLHREAVEVAVDSGAGMSGQLDREARAPQAADDRVVVPQRRRTRGRPRLDR